MCEKAYYFTILAATDEHFHLLCFARRRSDLLSRSLSLSLADLLNVTETKSWHESFARLSTLKNDLSCVSFLCSPPFLALSSPCDVFERSERSSLYDYYSSVLLFILAEFTSAKTQVEFSMAVLLQ